MALSAEGKSVGILDGDIFGPTVPLMMNIKETPLTDENNMIIPPVNYGIKWYYNDNLVVYYIFFMINSYLFKLINGTPR